MMAAWFAGALLAGPVWAQNVSAQGPESSQDVYTAIKNAAVALSPPGATITVGSLAGAKYMSACSQPLDVAMSGVIPYEQATVSCRAPSWTFYAQVTIAQSERVVVVARPIAAGSIIGIGDLMMVNEPVQQFAGRQVFFDTEAVAGAAALMSLASGTVITQQDVQQPLLVKAGQQMMVKVISGGIVVTVLAVADQDGRLGDLVLFTNQSSGRHFTAEVTANGSILNLN
jgi:flagella basal body P-ring formation protein FlgA